MRGTDTLWYKGQATRFMGDLELNVTGITLRTPISTISLYWLTDGSRIWDVRTPALIDYSDSECFIVEISFSRRKIKAC